MKASMAVALASILLTVPAATAATRQFEVLLHEFEGGLHLQPPEMRAFLGDVLEVNVINQGASPHNLLFCGDGSGPLEKCAEKWAFTPNLEANASARLTVALEKAGKFDYYCFIPGHKSLGMTGTLTVEDPDGGRDRIPGAPLAGLALAAGLGALLRRRSA